MPSTPKFAKADITNIRKYLRPILGAVIEAVDAVYIDNRVVPNITLKGKEKRFLLHTDKGAPVVITELPPKK